MLYGQFSPAEKLVKVYKITRLLQLSVTFSGLLACVGIATSLGEHHFPCQTRHENNLAQVLQFPFWPSESQTNDNCTSKLCNVKWLQCNVSSIHYIIVQAICTCNFTRPVPMWQFSSRFSQLSSRWTFPWSAYSRLNFVVCKATR